MKYILLSLVLLGCQPDPPTGVNPPSHTLIPPYCREIKAGGCPYLWCVSNNHSNWATGGMVAMSNTCTPVDARVEF